ncbi:MAG: hypothetical protein ACM37W_18265 [Actinomycetota bacterium]
MAFERMVGQWCDRTQKSATEIVRIRPHICLASATLLSWIVKPQRFYSGWKVESAMI